MGYDIYIGQGEYDSETKLYSVHHLNLPEAPEAHNDTMSAHVNHRYLSYFGWFWWCDAVGLYDLFFGSGGLMAQHPGATKLTPQHAYIIHAALERYQSTHPNVVPGCCGCSTCDPYSHNPTDPCHHPEYDYDLARLVWLDWWMKWSLQHCSNPMMANW